MEAVSALLFREQWELPIKRTNGSTEWRRGEVSRHNVPSITRTLTKTFWQAPSNHKIKFSIPWMARLNVNQILESLYNCFIICFFHKEDDDLEVTEASPRAGLEPRTTLANSVEKTQASSLDLALSSLDLKVLEDRMKLIDKRLSNLESEISLVIPFLRKALKTED